MDTTWTIAQLKRQPDNGLVFEATYIINFEYQGQTSRHVGSVELTGDANDPNFVPFEQLTQEVVLGWVQNAVTDFEEVSQRHQNYLQEKVDALNNPPHLEGLPWDNTPRL